MATSTRNDAPADVPNRDEIIGSLNRLLAQEHACYIRYLTHAVTVQGPWSESVATKLKAIAALEAHHAEELREIIDYLGGEPTMDVERVDLRPASALEDILAINIAEEQQAIAAYRAAMDQVDQKLMSWVYLTLMHIISEEEAHLHELRSLQLKGIDRAA